MPWKFCPKCTERNYNVTINTQKELKATLSKAQQSTQESRESEGAGAHRVHDCTEQDVKVITEKEKWKQTKIISVVKESCSHRSEQNG